MSNKKNGDLYHKLRQLWKDVHPNQSKKKSEDDLILWWATNNKDRAAIENKIKQYEFTIKGRGLSILQSLANHAKIRKVTSIDENKDIPRSSNSLQVTPTASDDIPLISIDVEMADAIEVPNNAVNTTGPSTLINVALRKTVTPAQKIISEELSAAQKELSSLTRAKNSGMILVKPQQDRIRELSKFINLKTHKLNRLKSLQRSQARFRLKIKSGVPLVAREQPGRPRIEDRQPGLLKAIVDIVSVNGSANERRRMESISCAHTLDQLLSQLRDLGYNISRMGLYLRLLPRNCATTGGKRHTNTVPVKLMKARNTLMKQHIDSHFATATIKYLKDLAVTFGTETVCCLSQDDKAKIPLGLTAATKQGPILMKVDYMVRLPDHDFVVASKHKLIPSVYAGLEIKHDQVSYSGPTYIAVRSGKHDSSTAPRHGEDLERILKLKEFENFLTIPEDLTALNGVISPRIPKPILILLVDGGPDENPRFPKTLHYAALNFRRMNLDAMFIGTHGPGQSAYNPVKRRMSPLSRDLCGLILPHDALGSHLNGAGKTINGELEVKNFQRAGEILCEIWNERVLDGYPVVTEYVLPGKNERVSGKRSDTASYVSGSIEEQDATFLTEEWKSAHVRQSKYLLQIVKCGNIECCTPLRTNLCEFLRGQFISTPVPISRSTAGLTISEGSDGTHFFNLTTRLAVANLLEGPINCFDKYCPSVKSTIGSRTCKECGEYFVTKASLKSHSYLHKKSTNYDHFSSDDEMENILQVELNESEDIYIIENLADWLQNPFTDICE